MKVFYMVLLLVMAGFFGFIGWMNATPGHYQIDSENGCCPVKVVYAQNANPQECRMLCDEMSFMDKALLSLSSIDLNR